MPFLPTQGAEKVDPYALPSNRGNRSQLSFFRNEDLFCTYLVAPLSHASGLPITWKGTLSYWSCVTIKQI